MTSGVEARLVPLGDRVLIRVEDLEDAKIGRIVLSDTRAERTRVADVLRVGPGVVDKSIEVDGKVLISVYSGTNVNMPKYGEISDTLKLVREDEILAVFY